MRFLERGEEQVATRSPRPARPAKVRGSAPMAVPRRVISARPRVMREARVLRPQCLDGLALSFSVCFWLRAFNSFR